MLVQTGGFVLSSGIVGYTDLVAESFIYESGWIITGRDSTARHVWMYDYIR